MYLEKEPRASRETEQTASTDSASVEREGQYNPALATDMRLDPTGDVKLYGFVPYESADRGENARVELSPGLPQASRYDRIQRTAKALSQQERVGNIITSDGEPEDRVANTQGFVEQSIEQKTVLELLLTQQEMPGSVRQISGPLPPALENRISIPALKHENHGIRLLVTPEVVAEIQQRLGAYYDFPEIQGSNGKLIEATMTVGGPRARNPESEHFLMVVGQSAAAAELQHGEATEQKNQIILRAIFHELQNHTHQLRTLFGEHWPAHDQEVIRERTISDANDLNDFLHEAKLLFLQIPVSEEQAGIASESLVLSEAFTIRGSSARSIYERILSTLENVPTAVQKQLPNLLAFRKQLEHVIKAID